MPDPSKSKSDSAKNLSEQNYSICLNSLLKAAELTMEQNFRIASTRKELAGISDSNPTKEQIAFLKAHVLSLYSYSLVRDNMVSFLIKQNLP